jgi:hypothetical protein
MNANEQAIIDEAETAARRVLHYNIDHSETRLMRTAAWGYPEPYTRDLMLAALGMLVAGDDQFVDVIRRTLIMLAENQTGLGHITSLAHDPNDLGSSDTTPLFLMGLACYRQTTGETDFLDEAAHKALTWMEYQSPDDLVMVGQLPTSDWRDEHWVLGYGLYVNTLVYAYLKMFGDDERAERLRKLMNRLDIRKHEGSRHVHEGLVVRDKPYYAMCAYKNENNERFDLLGNCLAVLTGIASHSRANNLIRWIESECDSLGQNEALAVRSPPCLIPFIQPNDPDWRPRYEQFNLPGNYHNGGVWPFICGLHVASCVAVERYELAEKKLVQLTQLVKLAKDDALDWGFNEWIKAQTAQPSGCDWQTWSAAMYLYAVHCVKHRRTAFFDGVCGDLTANV